MASIEEIRELIAGTAEISRQNSEAIRELQASQAEADKRSAEAAKSWKEGQKRWDEGLAELKRQREEMREHREEIREEMREHREEIREEMREHREEMREELIASRQESDRIWTAIYAELRNIRHDVGGLGNKLGVMTESMFFPSLDRILRHLRQDGIDQILNHLGRLSKFYPEHRGKKAYGILGAILMPDDIKAKALKAGIYVASIRDDVFELLRPEGFEPRAFPI